MAAEGPVDLEAAHDALVGALEDADDPALGPLCRVALETGHDAVAVEGFADIRCRHVEVGLAFAPDLGHHEAVAGRAAREPAHDEVHAVRQPDVGTADLDEQPVGDEPPQDRRQLAPSGGVEGELAREVAHRYGLAEARHEVEHPAIETCCVVYRDSVMRMVVPEVGLEPTLAEANTALNRARLPIPPLRQRNSPAWYQGTPWPSRRGPYLRTSSHRTRPRCAWSSGPDFRPLGARVVGVPGRLLARLVPRQRMRSLRSARDAFPSGRNGP